MIGWHVENPTHRIEVGGNEQCALLHPDYHTQYWNGQHFEDTNLRDLGLRLQLGHPPGERCSNPSSIHNDFVVLDINGVHDVTLCFCECQTAQSRTTQLLRMHWFPATTLELKTAATFRLLHNFHILSFESKASTFEYWQTLACLTNNTGLDPPKVSSQFDLIHLFLIVA
jgi:hypothetical protein